VGWRKEALARLPRQQRAVLVLRYCEDLSEVSGAELLGCLVGTVRTHAHRGLRTLRERLGEKFDRFEVNETGASQRDSG
jgi:RNA polymerase sigma factor (sigma-70 family)